jgi:hypothetical protein
MRSKLDSGALPFLRFDSAAQDRFDAWRTELEQRLRSGDLHPAMESHLAKFRSLIPSLALILHLLDGDVGPVTLTAIEKAIQWDTYLESHARRLYAGVTDSSALAAKMLAARIQRGEVQDDFAARDVYHKDWTGLDRKRTEEAIDVLLSLNWLEERKETTTGRPKTRYVMNPKIKISPKSEPTKPPKGTSGSNVGADS